MSWLVKRRHYGGGESVIARYTTSTEAAKVADSWNTLYQTDNYYIEQYDRAKVEGWS